MDRWIRHDTQWHKQRSYASQIFFSSNNTYICSIYLFTFNKLHKVKYEKLLYANGVTSNLSWQKMQWDHLTLEILCKTNNCKQKQYLHPSKSRTEKHYLRDPKFKNPHDQWQDIWIIYKWQDIWIIYKVKMAYIYIYLDTISHAKDQLWFLSQLQPCKLIPWEG